MRSSCMSGRPSYLLGGVDHSETVAKLQGPQNCGKHSHYQSACYLLWDEKLILRQGHRFTSERTNMVRTHTAALCGHQVTSHNSRSHLFHLCWQKK